MGEIVKIHDLLPDDWKAKLPPLRGQEHIQDPMVYVHFYSDGTEQWHWFCMEGSLRGRLYVMFGLVVGWEAELGEIYLLELEAVNNRSIELVPDAPPDFTVVSSFTLPQIINGRIYLDTSWIPKRLSQVRREYGS